MVTKLDRLARSVPDARDIVDELTAAGVKLNIGGSVHRDGHPGRTDPALPGRSTGPVRRSPHAWDGSDNLDLVHRGRGPSMDARVPTTGGN